MTSRHSVPRPQTIPNGSYLSHKGGWVAVGAAAAVLAGSALFNRRSAKRAEAACPPEGEFIEVDGVRLHYVDRGDGDVVVLLHGNGVTLQDFEASGVLGSASEQFRVIAFDRPGFGYSDRPRTTAWTPSAQARTIAGALRKLGIERAIFAGHSWGAMVALAMALEEPQLVSGLLLLSGYYYPTLRPDVAPLSTPAIPLLGDIMAQTVSPLAGRLAGPAGIKASFFPAPVSPKFAAFPIGLTLRPSQVRAAAADTAMMIPAAFELSRRYAELNVPIIVMAGEGDLIAHVDKHAERFSEEVDRAELRVLPDQGHLFHYAAPEAVTAAMRDLTARDSFSI